MLKKISSLPVKSVIGCNFVTDDGTSFTVLEGDHYPQSTIARQHQKYCEALRDGILVSLSFRGKPVPVVKVTDGVVRLTRITVACAEVGNLSSVMSEALGVSETRQPMGLYHP